jgi:8-oxo-dGTP diphosphatase
MNTKPLVKVAAGVLQCADGRYLMAERPAHKILGGYLEFPGGKLEPGETPEAALVREFEEELGVTVTATEPLVRFEHAYPEQLIRAFMFRVTSWRGEPRGREGQKLIYAEPRALPTLPLLPANKPILAALALPATLAVTPLLEAPIHENFLTRFEHAVKTYRPGGAIVRCSDAALSKSVASGLVAIAERAHCALFLNSGDPREPPQGFAGVHLSAAAVQKLAARPELAGRLGASVHTPYEARKAGELGLDYVLAGSVRETPSHPDAAPLGWRGYDALVRAAGLPAYAIGGMTPEDVPEVRRHWGQGIAAIRALGMRS